MRIRGFEDATLHETHISWVWVGETRVLKRKKPVRFGFLDFSTLERRRAACEAEKELNDRTAPGVTLGVRPLTTTNEPDLVEVDGPGDVVDVVVEMVRLPDDRRLADLAESGRLTDAHLVAVGHFVAEFHARAPEVPDSCTHDALAALLEENFETTDEFDTGLTVAQLGRVRALQESLVGDPIVDQRRAAGRCRDGHGDLRTDHVYLLDDLDSPRIVAIDGVEFDVAYRAGDVAMDVAFLAMDLWLHVSRPAAERMVAAWVDANDDAGVYAVLDRYIAYRAWVRGKVRALGGHADQARARFALAAEVATWKASARGAVIAVAGPIAAGKSTLAAKLARALAGPHFAADRVRKRLAGVTDDTSLGTRPFAGAYSAEASARVYEGLVDRARWVWKSGRLAIVDASFHDPVHHELLRAAAAEDGVTLRFVRCEAPVEVLRERLRARTSGPSDAREPLLEPFLAQYRPPEGDDVVAVDTSAPVAIDELLAALDLPGTR